MAEAATLERDPKLRDLVEQIVAKLDPVAIYLFGSRAHGTARADSDYDLLIVVPDDFPRERARPSVVYPLIDRRQAAADLLTIYEKTFAEKKDLKGTISYEAAHNGVKIYARSRARALA